MPCEMARTAVVGVGNILMGDEGAGVRAVEQLLRQALPDEVELYDGGTAFHALIGELAPFVDRVNIDLDIPGSLSPKLGMECSLFPKHSPDSPRRWRALLDYAVRRGLCMPSKADALLRFPGEATESSDAARWPESLRQLSRLMGARYLSVLTRGLHHLKIVYRAGAPLRAKAYLSVRHSWVPAIRRSTETEG